MQKDCDSMGVCLVQSQMLFQDNTDEEVEKSTWLSLVDVKVAAFDQYLWNGSDGRDLSANSDLKNTYTLLGWSRAKVQQYGQGMDIFSPEVSSAEVTVRVCSRKIMLRTGDGEHCGRIVVLMSRSRRCRWLVRRCSPRLKSDQIRNWRWTAERSEVLQSHAFEQRGNAFRGGRARALRGRGHCAGLICRGLI